MSKGLASPTCRPPSGCGAEDPSCTPHPVPHGEELSGWLLDLPHMAQPGRGSLLPTLKQQLRANDPGDPDPRRRPKPGAEAREGGAWVPRASEEPTGQRGGQHGVSGVWECALTGHLELALFQGDLRTLGSHRGAV